MYMHIPEYIGLWLKTRKAMLVKARNVTNQCYSLFSVEHDVTKNVQHLKIIVLQIFFGFQYSPNILFPGTGRTVTWLVSSRAWALARRSVARCWAHRAWARYSSVSRVRSMASCRWRWCERADCRPSQAVRCCPVSACDVAVRPVALLHVSLRGRKPFGVSSKV